MCVSAQVFLENAIIVNKGEQSNGCNGQVFKLYEIE